jgi:hypothetical protein
MGKMEERHDEDSHQDDLRPWGQLLSGSEGISASRFASHLGVPVTTVKKICTPIGQMKMPYRNPFDVYDTATTNQFRDHPEIVKARERRLRRSRSDAASRAVETRREKCVSQLLGDRSDLRSLYDALVRKLWSAATEGDLLKKDLYRKMPAQLWDALDPISGAEHKATEIIIDMLWACTKQRTWKVNESGGQDQPMLFMIFGPMTKSNLSIYENCFAAAIRHLWFHNLPSKFEGRQRALKELNTISRRTWPSELQELDYAKVFLKSKTRQDETR